MTQRLSHPTESSNSQQKDVDTIAAFVRKRLEQTPRPIISTYANSSTYRRNSDDVSPTSSIASIQSFGSRHTYETDATDFLMTPNRSRTGTVHRSERIVSLAAQQPTCKPPLRIVLGTASIGSHMSPLAKINTVEQTQKFVDLFHRRGYMDIDTARAYPVGRGGTCERLLGEPALRLSKWANVSTKVSSFMPGSHKPRNIARSIDMSLDALKMDNVDIMYLHAPDRTTPFYVTCEAMNQAFQEGKFERFGLSNFLVKEVEQIVQICEQNGFVKPSVYQGQYNPICRGAEKQLLEVLRKHNIAFYAYSPSACGFFSNKVTRASTQDKDSRWSLSTAMGTKYVNDYFHDPLFAAADFVREHAKKFGISGHAAALRWTTWHSDLEAAYGDAIIIGASKLTQLHENLEILEQGPLPGPLVDIMNSVWEDVRTFQKGPRFSFV